MDSTKKDRGAGCGVKIIPDINPILYMLGWKGLVLGIPKNASYVEIGLMKTGLDLIKSCGWCWDGLSIKLVKPWA